MYLKTVYSRSNDPMVAIPEMVGKLKGFKVPTYTQWAQADEKIVGRRTEDMFRYLTAETGEQLPSSRDVHRWVVSTMGRGYAGITGIVDHWSLLRPSAVYFDREVRQQQDFYFDREDGGTTKVWQLGNNISHYYYPTYYGKSFVHSYSFLEIQVPVGELKKWRTSVKSHDDPQVNHIRYPVFVLDHELLSLMDRHGLLVNFERAINRLAQTCSHDFAHHYVFPSVDEVGIDRELTRLVATLCRNIEPGRQQKNIETIAIMLNLAGYLHNKDEHAENVYSVVRAFMDVRDELCSKITDEKEVKAVRVVFNSIAVLLVSGFVPKEHLMANVDGDISDWKDLLKNPKHSYTPDKPMFVGYKDADLAAKLMSQDKQVPPEQVIYMKPAEIAVAMIKRYEAIAKSNER